MHTFMHMHAHTYTHTHTHTHVEIDVALQQQLLDKDKTNMKMDGIFPQMFSEVVGGKWPSLASLLSFTAAEVQELSEEQSPALTMLQKWREASQPTYSSLLGLLQAPFLLPSFFQHTLPKARPSAVRLPGNISKYLDVRLSNYIAKLCIS